MSQAGINRQVQVSSFDIELKLTSSSMRTGGRALGSSRMRRTRPLITTNREEAGSPCLHSRLEWSGLRTGQDAVGADASTHPAVYCVPFSNGFAALWCCVLTWALVQMSC